MLRNSPVSRAVPQVTDYIDVQPLSKGKTEKTKKKKESKMARAAVDSGFITLPAPNSVAASPGPSGLASDTGSPAPKPGFSRISSMAEPSSQGGTPAPSERSKVVFDFGTKRKATEDAEGSPAAKRR